MIIIAINKLILDALLSFYLYSQYMFVFQIPWLPEVALSLNDFDALEDNFRGKKCVCNTLRLVRKWTITIIF